MSRVLSEGHIGATVRGLRAARNLTQEQLAERAGLSRGTVTNVEGNVGVPGFDVVIKLARALGVSAAVFLPPWPEDQPPAAWETIARRLALTYEDALRLRSLLTAAGIVTTATTEQALLVWMRERKVLP